MPQLHPIHALSLTDLRPVIGRAREADAIHDAFGDARLVSLVGPPGIGKTRLAVHHVQGLGPRERVFVVDLADASTLDDLVRSVAAAADLTLGRSGEDVVARLGVCIADAGPALWLFDNFESVSGESAVVARWLSVAPAARFLVTTQARLRVLAEHPIELAPLPVESGPPDAGAVALFLRQAAQARPGYAPTTEDLDQIRELARRVDGIPLAVVLLASRMDVWGPSQLLKRLSRGRPARARHRDLPQRHTSMQAAMQSAWHLLDLPEQLTLAQLSVFVGGFDVELAEAVVELPPELDTDVAEAVAGIRQKSLLFNAAAGPDGVVRLNMYSPVRELAAEKLEAKGNRSDTERRHGVAVLRRVEPLLPALRRTDEPRCRAVLMAEFDNLSAVVDRALRADKPNSEAAHRAAVCLDELLARHGPYRDQLDMLERLLALEAPVKPVHRAKVLYARGRTHRFLGRFVEGVEDIKEAGQIAAGAEAWPVVAVCCLDLAFSAHLVGRPDDTVQQAQAALDHLAKVENPEPSVVGGATGILGLGHCERGEYVEAERLLRRSIELLRAAGTVGMQGSGTVYLASTLRAVGRHEEAGLAYVEGLALLRSAGDRSYEIICLRLMASLHHERGQLDLAVARNIEAVSLAQEVGAPIDHALATSARAAAMADLGDLPGAKTLVQELAASRDQLPPNAQMVIHLQKGHILLAQAAGADARAERDQASALRARVLDLVAHAAKADVANEEVRSAARILGAVAHRSGAAQPGLLVHGEEGWIQLPDGARVDVARRANTRRVLWCLVRARLDRPDRPVALDELVAAGWPGERIRTESARARVYTAINTLRRWGLKPYLLTRDRGYLLDPEVSCTLTGELASSAASVVVRRWLPSCVSSDSTR